MFSKLLKANSAKRVDNLQVASIFPVTHFGNGLSYPCPYPVLPQPSEVEYDTKPREWVGIGEGVNPNYKNEESKGSETNTLSLMAGTISALPIALPVPWSCKVLICMSLVRAWVRAWVSYRCMFLIHHRSKETTNPPPPRFPRRGEACYPVRGLKVDKLLSEVRALVTKNGRGTGSKWWRPASEFARSGRIGGFGRLAMAGCSSGSGAAARGGLELLGGVCLPAREEGHPAGLSRGCGFLAPSAFPVGDRLS